MPARARTAAPPGARRGQAFWERLANAGRGVLLVDYDCALTPRDKAGTPCAYAGVRQPLEDIMAAGRTRLVIASGRPAHEIASLLQLQRLPEIRGSYGREELDSAGAYRVQPISTVALRGLATLDDWAPEIHRAGGQVEARPGAIIIRWDGESPMRINAIRQMVRSVWQMEQLVKTLEWHGFPDRIELRAPGCSKARIVEDVLITCPGNMPCAYLGDDIGDERAVAAVRSRGIWVLVHPESRISGADCRIRPPDQLVDFLRQWHEVSGGGG